MKRTLQVVAGLGLAAGVVLGATPAASAHETHHKACADAKRCRPEPLKPPPGGWPCAKDHSCSTRHHYPVCVPGKPKPPPVVAHPRPPKLTHHKPEAPKPRTPQHIPAAPVAHTAQLPRTGGLYDVGLEAGTFLLGAGGLLTFAGRKRS